MSKLAEVTARRLEEPPPGNGVPLGWLPEIVYHLIARKIPYRPEKPEYVLSLRSKGKYVLRRFAVSPVHVDDWEVEVKIGNKTVRERAHGRSFGEQPCWPPPLSPMMVLPSQDIILTIWRRPLSVSKTFECLFRGAEEASGSEATLH
jgi:hypothetical protein